MINFYPENDSYRWESLFLPLLLLLLLPIPSNAQTAHPGWENGSQLSGREVNYSSPTAYDLDSNQENGLEIVVGGSDGTVYALYADGTLFWQADLRIKACSRTGDTNKLFSSPAIGDVKGKGVPYVLIGYGGVGAGNCPGGVVTIDGTTGEILKDLNLKRYTNRNGIWANQWGVFSTPSLGDTNGDGKLEAAFGSFDRGIYLLSHKGKKLYWRYSAADTSWSSGAMADLDSDGFQELYIGTDISRNDALSPPTPDGGYVYRFKTTEAFTRKKCRRKKTARSLRCRRLKKRFTPIHHYFRSNSSYDWATEMNQTIFSSPILADVLSENEGPEVVVGSGCYFPADSQEKRGKWIKILNPRNGRVLQTLSGPGCSPSSAAAGDLDGDGDLEVVASFNVNGSSGVVMAWDPETGNELWRVNRSDSNAAHFQSPVIADLDGNGSQEVAIINSGKIHIIEGTTGNVLTRINAGVYRNTPAAIDIDLDGNLELIAAGSRNSRAAVWVWEDFSDLGSTPQNREPYSADWPMWRGNSARTGTAEVP